jgi:cell division protein FtsI/penicillin-binding protein 2
MKLRLAIFILINMIVSLIWVSYLFAVQMLDPHHLRSHVIRRQNYSKQILIPNRGDILDRNGQILVSSMKLYQIDIDRSAIIQFCSRHPEKNLTVSDLYQKIAGIISENSSLKAETIITKLNTSQNVASIHIADNFSESEMNSIQTLFSQDKIPGLVKTFSGIRRFYPKDKLAASLLGMITPSDRNANEKSNESIYNIQGVCGLEATFEADLSGKYGWREVVSDAKNQRIPFLFLKEQKPKSGNSVILTIDSNLQEIVETNLYSGIEKYSANHGIGIIMDPNTGEILAMAGASKDDKYKSASALRSLQNMPVSFMFEPGSVMKSITTLLAIEQKMYKMDDRIDCRKYYMENRIIKDSHDNTFLSFKDVLVHSSNVGISRIVEKIGSRKLYDRYIAMGFGHKTGSNLAGESAGIFRKLRDWQGFSLHSISFGQEISATALQVATAYCALANGGKMLKPIIHKEIIDEFGTVISSNEPQIVRTISDPESLEQLKEILKSVVDYGTAVGTKFEQLSVAGKTGTAEKSSIGGGYSKDKYTSVFAGFFPVEKPKYVMVIVYDEPDHRKYYHYASQSAVPTFKKIIQNMMNVQGSDLLIDIAERDGQFVEMPDVTGLPRGEALAILQNQGILYSIINHSEQNIVQDQFPKPRVRFDKNQMVIIVFDKKETDSYSNDDQFTMPDLKGLTIRRALQKANRNKIKLVVEGNGIIMSQSIAHGSKMEYGETCKVIAR